MDGQILIDSLSVTDFERIKKYIIDFELDNRALEKEQFLVAKQGEQIVGFGRIREYENCCELCSLGVIEPERNRGIGKELTKQLIKRSKQELFLVCIIPDFFRPFGFIETTDYPEALNNKLHYCTSELVVPETYVVMKHTASF